VQPPVGPYIVQYGVKTFPVLRVVSLALNSRGILRLPQSRVRQLLAALQGPILVASAYFLGAQAAFYIGTLSDQIFALFWPPNVILFCALLIVPQREWWRYIAVAFPAHAIAELGVGMPLPQLLVAFATNCMVAMLNAYAVRRFVGDPPWFGDFRKALIYIVITAGISPALSAFGGAFVPILGGGSPEHYWIFWSHWYLANALPNLTLGPVLLIWFFDGARWERWKPSHLQIEPVVVGLALLGACVLAALAGHQLRTNSFFASVVLLPMPLILWATVRFGEKGASAAVLTVAVILTWRTLQDGVFPGADPERNVLALQLLLTGLSIPFLLLGALIDELREAERNARSIAASLLRAQDEERRRIARDLHDSTGQNLVAATLIAGRVENVVPETERSAFAQLMNMLQQSIREVRTVSYLLHPPLLEEAGLSLALRHFVDGFMARSGIAVDVEIEPDVERLPADTELVLFRVVQEALTNVFRHSTSKTARIRLGHKRSRRRKEIVLTVEDAGKGMAETSGAGRLTSRKRKLYPKYGVGLASMRDRLDQIGGRLEIDSVAGATIVKAVVPVS
jgi:signal transduction histidine kinase